MSNSEIQERVRDTEQEKEQMKIDAEGLMLSDFIKSNGYQAFRTILLEKVVQLSDIMTFEATVEALAEIQARKKAINIILDTLKEIEGKAAQWENNKALLLQVKTSTEYIQRII